MLIRWGDHHWMVEFDMDCFHTEQGWFEVKSFLTNGEKKYDFYQFGNKKKELIGFLGQGWENDVHQIQCQGTSGGVPPFSSKNHIAKCGSVNKFDFQSGTCEINDFPTTETPTPGITVNLCEKFVLD